MRNANRPRLSAAFAATLLLSACAAPLATRQPATGEPVTVGIVAINDFHGSLEPPRQSVTIADGAGGSVSVPAGGAAWLASAIDGVRAKYPNHVTVAAGDMISASQLASSIYLDEPTIGVMNRIGLEFTAVGNHEFDRGWRELLRVQNGGCEKNTSREPCQIERFDGARFKYLAASTRREDGTTLFPATGLKSFGQGAGKVTVGFVGLTLKGTPDLVSAAGIKGLSFADEADTINAAIPRLKAEGADAVVVLIHQGGRTKLGSDPSSCADFAGDIQPIIARLNPGVDVIVSGHTHWAYVCDYAAIDPARPILLTSAGVYGELVTDITLRIDPKSKQVVGKSATNLIVQSAPYTSSKGAVANTALVPQFQPRADVRDYVARYVDAAKLFAERPVGKLTGPATRRTADDVDLGGSLGALIADSQLAATRGAGAQIAFMNPFGIRAPLVPAPSGEVTFAMIYAVQPFGNDLITQTLTGAELATTLELGFADSGPQQFLSPSQGFAYVVDRAAPPGWGPGKRLVSMTLNGKPIDPTANYRVTFNGFLANGGDGFDVLASKRDAVVGVSDLEALEAWLKSASPRPVPTAPRVTEARR